MYALIAVLLGFGVLIVLMRSDKRKILSSIGNLLGHYKLDKKPLTDRIFSKVNKTADSFDAIGYAGMRSHLMVFSTSLALWICLYTFYYCMTLAMHMDIGYIPAIVASSFVVFTTVLPIQGIGGFGTIEGGWAVGFILVAIPHAMAVSSAFGFHIIMLLYTILFGGWGYISLIYAGYKLSPKSTF